MKEVQAMFEKKLSYLGRAGFVALAIIGLLVTIKFATIAFGKIPKGETGFFIHCFTRTATVPGMIVALAWTVLMAWVALKGKFKLRTQPPLLATIFMASGFFFTATMMFVFILPETLENPVGWRSIFGTQLVLMGFFLLVTIGICVVLRILYRVEFRTQEKLLEIEYRIAELAEKLESKPGK